MQTAGSAISCEGRPTKEPPPTGEQLRPETRAALFGNVGTIITFQVGGQDAPVLAQELYQDNFGYLVTADELQQLPAYRAYLKTLLKGRSTAASEFLARPPLSKQGGENKRDRVLAASTQRFTRSRPLIDRKLNRFLSSRF